MFLLFIQYKNDSSHEHKVSACCPLPQKQNKNTIVQRTIESVGLPGCLATKKGYVRVNVGGDSRPLHCLAYYMAAH